MFDWNDEELGDIIWGEASEVGDHIVPYPKGNEAKPLFTTGDHRKKQCLENSRPAKFADQKVSGANSFFSGSKVENDSECNTKETLPAPGIEVDSWPDSPLINVACDGKYAGRNSGSSVYMQPSDFGAEMPKYDSARADTAQLDDRSGLFGNECEDKEHDGFLEYSWDNVGAFDDLDSMFRNDDPIFGREGLGSGELWSSSADIFTSPAKSFPTCSPNSSVNALSMSDHEMKMEFVQQEDSSHTPGFGRTDHLCSYDTKDIDLRKENSSGKEGCHHADPVVDCVGGMTDTSLGKTNPKMIDTMEAWKTNSSSKVNGKRKLVKCPTKEETDERSSQDLHGSWSLTANQLQSFGDQFALSSVQSIPSSVSSQKQHVAPVSLAYWQTSNPYLSSLDDNPQRHCTVMPTFQNARSERDMHQLALVDYGNSSGSLKHSNPMNVFPAPSRPPIMTPQEKLEKLKRRQQMQAMLAIQEQQQQFGHKAPHADLYNTEKCPRENQHQDAEGSSIDVEENLNIPPLMEPKTPAEHNYSNTVAMVLDDCSLEEKVLDQLQGVIGKLDIKVRLCIRDSLFRLAQSASQRHNTLDTSSTNNNMQCDGVAQKDEAYVHNRLPRIPEVETETNPIDRTIAHLLFHQPLEPFSRPVKDCEAPESPGFTKLICEPKTECMKNLSAGCLSECSIDEGSLSQPSCMETDTKDVDQFQSNTYINPPEKTSNGELEDLGE